MKMYTGRGDEGGTDLLGERVTKADPRIELMGDLDESTSSIGLGRALLGAGEAGDILIAVQRDLYQIMAELAFIDTTRPDSLQFGSDRLAWLETTIERVQASFSMPREFVLPGESVPGAALDVARTVVRRAERKAVAEAERAERHNPDILRYLNRLSTLLFVLARAEDVRVHGDVRLAKGDQE